MQPVPERPADRAAVEQLLDQCFGTNRVSRPSYRFRDSAAPLSDLGFVVRDGESLVGTIRFWPVRIGDSGSAILLGPLAVRPDYRGRGLASRLVTRGLGEARERGHRIVFVVGEIDYLGRFGFISAREADLSGAPVPDQRFLVLALDPAALDGVTGAVRAIS